MELGHTKHVVASVVVHSSSAVARTGVGDRALDGRWWRCPDARVQCDSTLAVVVVGAVGHVP